VLDAEQFAAAARPARFRLRADSPLSTTMSLSSTLDECFGANLLSLHLERTPALGLHVCGSDEKTGSEFGNAVTANQLTKENVIATGYRWNDPMFDQAPSMNDAEGAPCIVNLAQIIRIVPARLIAHCQLGGSQSTTREFAGEARAPCYR
jgi:hypothetical protein